MRGLTCVKSAQDHLQIVVLTLAEPCFLAHSQAVEALMLLLKGGVACNSAFVKSAALGLLSGADSDESSCKVSDL